MMCVKNNEYECKMMDKPCNYGKEYDKAVDTVFHTLKSKIPLCTWDSDCDECDVFKTQLACIILGDLLNNGIKVGM